MSTILHAVLVPPSKSATFEGLGFLPGGEFSFSHPHDISANGLVVVGESQSANGLEAFRWSASTGMVGLGSLGGEEFSSAALGVSEDGLTVVGGSRSPKSGDRFEPFRWTAAIGMVGLGDLAGGEYSGYASGVSSDGSVVTGASTSSESPEYGEAYRWTSETGLIGLGVLPGAASPSTVPNRTSADGSVIVGWAFTENGREALRWSESEGLVAMGDLPGGSFDSVAIDVSADGSIVVGTGDSPGTTVFRWTAATGMVDLGRPANGNYSMAWGISATGSVIVGEAGIAGERVPLIWDEAHGMRNLIDVLGELGLDPQAEGWNLEQASAVSADGQTIVGWGFNPQGDQEAWLAHLGQPTVVEVPTLSLWALALLSALLGAVAVVALRARRVRAGFTPPTGS